MVKFFVEFLLLIELALHLDGLPQDQPTAFPFIEPATPTRLC